MQTTWCRSNVVHGLKRPSRGRRARPRLGAYQRPLSKNVLSALRDLDQAKRDHLTDFALAHLIRLITSIILLEINDDRTHGTSEGRRYSAIEGGALPLEFLRCTLYCR